jgi:hypothetical protein
MNEVKPNIIPFVVGGTKRELAIAFRQQKKGFKEPQPLDQEPATVTARIKVNGSWVERAMAWDAAESEWIYRFTSSDFTTINPAVSATYDFNCRLVWADGYTEYSPTEGRDFLKFYPNS